jgi:hypothetical protein
MATAQAFRKWPVKVQTPGRSDRLATFVKSVQSFVADGSVAQLGGPPPKGVARMVQVCYFFACREVVHRAAGRRFTEHEQPGNERKCIFPMDI